MYLFFVLLAIAVTVGAALLATGRGGQLTPARSDRPEPVLPELGRLTPSDVYDVRFAVGARGYRMDQVDMVLERLADELAQRDDELARLRAAVQPDSVPREDG